MKMIVVFMEFAVVHSSIGVASSTIVAKVICKVEEFTALALVEVFPLLELVLLLLDEFEVFEVVFVVLSNILLVFPEVCMPAVFKLLRAEIK